MSMTTDEENNIMIEHFILLSRARSLLTPLLINLLCDWEFEKRPRKTRSILLFLAYSSGLASLGTKHEDGNRARI